MDFTFGPKKFDPNEPRFTPLSPEILENLKKPRPVPLVSDNHIFTGYTAKNHRQMPRSKSPIRKKRKPNNK